MNCGPRSHIVDSQYYNAGYTTDEARRVFCDQRRLQRWLDVEVALAECQAKLGIIPAPAAVELAATADLRLLDRESIRQGILNTGHSLIPLLNAWQEKTGPESARYIHYGATTQDIQDTAQVLEIKDILAIVHRDLAVILEQLVGLASQHRDLVMVGRTHNRHALPTTLGLKIAVWIDEILRHADRLNDCGSRVLVSQLAGGVGTMAALGPQAAALLADFSDRIGLSAPRIAWHSARDRLAELLTTMALLAGSLGKIANEICQLARDEIGEMEEPFNLGKIGSTTMPHKRNPELCEQVVVLARLIKSAAGIGLDTLINEHERDYRAVRLEWVAVTDASLYLCGALALMKKILAGLVVHENRIRQNLDNSAMLIGSEALMFLLGKKIGKQQAHDLLYRLAMQAQDNGQPFLDLIRQHPEIDAICPPELLAKTLDPANHIGLAAELTDTVLLAAREFLATRTAVTGEPACPLCTPTGECPS